jgi:tryptophan-rich sensory protein
VNIFKVDGKKNIGVLFISILATEGVGILAIFLGISGQQVYQSLKKPVFAPPIWVLPLTWTILFLFMALAAYRIWLKCKSGQNIRKALNLYVLQLVLSLLWITIFFRWALYGLAFIESLLLLIFILMTTFKFFKIDKKASFMMIPYILWVSFAGVLNYVIWMLNEAV